MTSSENPVREAAKDETRTLDASALKALAHPLRVRILDLLAERGPQTASSLAALIGESSGVTSYHLRALAARPAPSPGLWPPERCWRGRPGLSQQAAARPATPRALVWPAGATFA